MSLITAIWLALVVLSTSTVLAVTGLVSLRVVRTVRERRHDRLVAEVRPLVVRAIDEEQALVLDRSGWRVAEEVAQTLLGKLRGADRAALGDLLEERGVLATARRDLLSRRTHRRLAAVELLGSAGDELSGPSLRGRLRDTDQDVRTAAARALGRIGAADAVPDLLLAIGERRVPAHVVTMAVLRIGPPAMGAVVTGLDHELTEVRVAACQLTGVLGATVGAERLVELLDDPDRRTRLAATTALGRLGMPRGVAPLIERLEAELALPEAERDVDLACALVDALGRIGHRSAIPVLEATLGHGYRLSMAAAAVLAEVGPRRSPRSVAERAAATARIDGSDRDVGHEIGHDVGRTDADANETIGGVR